MTRRVLEQIGLVLLGIVIFFWTMAPLYNMLIMSITPVNAIFAGKFWPDNPTLGNYATVFRQENHYLTYFWRQLFNSAFIAAASLIVVLAVASLASFAVGRLKLRFAPFVNNLALATYLIPAAFLAIPFYQVLAFYGLLDSQWGLVFAVVTFTTPYAIWVLRNYADSIPFMLDEAAMVDGASRWQIFCLVYLPLIRPAMIAIGTFALLHAWNEYLYAFLILSHETRVTLTVTLGLFRSDDSAPWPLLMAVGVLYSIPPAALYFSVRKYMVTGLTSGGVKD
ncbi:MAG: carbohydrate ABC transporter permease [Alphaproteobacteria bacterium]|nr:carbohydrate ABC transporter permease [Alphaproteobacteria bacterium]